MQKCIDLKFDKGTKKRKPGGQLRIVGFSGSDVETAAQAIIFNICYELKYCTNPVYAETVPLNQGYISVCDFTINTENITFEDARQEIRALFVKLKKRYGK